MASEYLPVVNIGRCGNCDVKLEPDPPDGYVQLSVKDLLYPEAHFKQHYKFITVGEAVSSIFKCNMSEEMIQSKLCCDCSAVLQDLYPVWTSFKGKTKSSSAFGSVFSKDNCSETCDGSSSPDPTFQLEAETMSKDRLEARIARREKFYSSGRPQSIQNPNTDIEKVETPKRGTGRARKRSHEEEDPLFIPVVHNTILEDQVDTPERGRGRKRPLEDPLLIPMDNPIETPFKEFEDESTDDDLSRDDSDSDFDPDGPFRCSVENCGKVFQNPWAHKVHMNLHLGLKPFICKQCGWSTVYKPSLRKHLRIHLKPEEKEELKTQVCHVCGAKFAFSEGLRKHMLVHSNDKPWLCSFEGCQLKFKTRVKLRRHEEQVHLDATQKFQCERCGREFNRKDNLSRHLEVHEKYELNGGKMRKSRDPPPRNKTKKSEREVSSVKTNKASDPP